MVVTSDCIDKNFGFLRLARYRLPGCLLIGLTGALVANPSASADTYLKLESDHGLRCSVNTATSRSELKNGNYGAAAGGFTLAIEWMKATCDVTAFLNRKELLKHYRDRARAYAGLGNAVGLAGDLGLLLNENSSYENSLDYRDDWVWIQPALDEAVSLQPENARFLKARADALTAQGNHDAALQDYELAIRNFEDPAERASAYYRRSNTLGALKRKQDQLADLSEAVKLDQRPIFFSSRADVHRQLDQPQAAIEDYSRAIALAPDNTYYLEQRADLLRRTGQIEKAQDDFTDLIQTNPKNADWIFEHMLIALELGQEKAAAADNARLDELRPRYLKVPANACRVAESMAMSGQKQLDPKLTRQIWQLGDVIVTIPLRHLIGKQTEKTAKTWKAVSGLVRKKQTKIGDDPTGLEPIPRFTGSKKTQVRKAMAFILNQRKTMADVLTRDVGKQLSAVFTVSASGHMLYGLNLIGAPQLNAQLTEMIVTSAPQSGLSCDIWAAVAAEASKRGKNKEVVAAWQDAKRTMDKLFPKTR